MKIIAVLSSFFSSRPMCWSMRTVVSSAPSSKGDPHFRMGCRLCHKGDEKGQGKEAAHKGMIKRPSDSLRTCGRCHKQVADSYSKSLHYTTAGQRNGVIPRFSKAELKAFDAKVFEQSCRSCHASCGDCHVKAPAVRGSASVSFRSTNS
jgi:hypothetical protein